MSEARCPKSPTGDHCYCYVEYEPCCYCDVHAVDALAEAWPKHTSELSPAPKASE